jgi:mannonate dehydratase
MRVAVGQFSEAVEEVLVFACQIGAEGVVLNTPKLPGERRWEYEDLQALKERCESYGLRLESLENVPLSFYDKAMLGLTGRDEQIENYQQTIRNMGRAGISILGYHWMPNGVWRTSRETPTRGGALATSFDMDVAEEPVLTYGSEDSEVTSSHMAPVKDTRLTHGRIFDEEEMWENYEYFIRAVLPVAEESGVRLALHPDDPPVESLGGVARLMRSFEGFERAMRIGDSPNHGLNFCMGSWSEMGPGVIEAMRHFGSQNKIFYVHFRDVKGHVPKFEECFLGEGNVDVVEAMRTLEEVGFDGCIIDDHVPALVNDTGWGHRGRALATGYIVGLMAAIKSS